MPVTPLARISLMITLAAASTREALHEHRRIDEAENTGKSAARQHQVSRVAGMPPIGNRINA
jgi:hypothetical protein